MSNAKSKSTAPEAPAAPAPVAKKDEFPRFRSTTGKPVLVVTTLGGHSISVTHQPEGTPLHPRFVRQATMQGCLPIASFTEVQAEDDAQLAAAGRDRAAILRSCIVDMVQVATDDPNRERELFTADGRPRTDAMGERLGFPVSTEERDTAWRAYAGDEAGFGED